ncbi:NAD(P)-binding protein [Lophiostoma macrostomum CBS 122681]|uniref:NAD(P)-binding protein n=1 Tax=Lophiostoma macrostomum CBS 122681 TaxID=1314788 RepID=A0A6A6TPQ8_9PLEO|nr:NAD(P)-binding protein [Lophiostoma macrostomum CBS 122681]
MPTLEIENLGSVVLVGGSGFLGSFIIDRLLSVRCTTSIAIADIRPPATPTPSIPYYHLDISSESSIRAVLSKTRPKVIFHLASPLPGKPRAAFHECNIVGTRLLLRLAQESPYVDALVHTSTNQVLANPLPSTEPLTESRAILWTDKTGHRTEPYGHTKAIADAMVRSANSPSLKTVALRFPNVYGGTDTWMTILMDDLRGGRSKIQLGETSAIVELITAESAADAHVLAASALLSPSKSDQVAGEAFLFSDEQPDTWHGFARRVWAEAGHPVTSDQVWIVPFWVLFVAAWITEWAVWLLSFGTRESLMFHIINVRKLRDGQHVFDIGKAKRVLGFRPVDERGREEGIKRAVRRNIEDFEKRQRAKKE